MPAKSKAQQKFMGMVYATKKGGKPASPAVAKVAKKISKKEAKKFAKTKHKGLPSRINEDIKMVTTILENVLSKEQIGILVEAAHDDLWHACNIYPMVRHVDDVNYLCKKCGNVGSLDNTAWGRRWNRGNDGKPVSVKWLWYSCPNCGIKRSLTQNELSEYISQKEREQEQDETEFKDAFHDATSSERSHPIERKREDQFKQDMDTLGFQLEGVEHVRSTSGAPVYPSMEKEETAEVNAKLAGLTPTKSEETWDTDIDPEDLNIDIDEDDFDFSEFEDTRDDDALKIENIIELVVDKLDPKEIDRLIDILTSMRAMSQDVADEGLPESRFMTANLIEDTDVDDKPLTKTDENGQHKCEICGAACAPDKSCSTDGCPNNSIKEEFDVDAILHLLEAVGDKETAQKGGVESGKARRQLKMRRGVIRGLKNIVNLRDRIAAKRTEKAVEPIGRYWEPYSKEKEAERTPEEVAVAEALDALREMIFEESGNAENQRFIIFKTLIEGVQSTESCTLESKQMKSYKLIKESAKGQLSRRTYRMLEVASAGRTMTEDKWRDKIGDDNMKVAMQFGLLKEEEEQPPLEGTTLGGEEAPPEDAPIDSIPGDEKHFLGNVIALHVYGDDTYADVLPTLPEISLRNNFSEIRFPNGDTLYLAKSLEDLKNNVELGEKELEALFNAGLVDSDDDGNYLI